MIRLVAGRLRAGARRLWRLLRQWSGDAAYETYVSRARDGERLSRAAFYLESVERRYREPNRCC